MERSIHLCTGLVDRGGSLLLWHCHAEFNHWIGSHLSVPDSLWKLHDAL